MNPLQIARQKQEENHSQKKEVMLTIHLQDLYEHAQVPAVKERLQRVAKLRESAAWPPLSVNEWIQRREQKQDS